MTRLILAIVTLSLVTGCGVKRKLIRPKDIPAYEEKQRKKREQLGIESPEDAETEKAKSESTK